MYVLVLTACIALGTSPVIGQVQFGITQDLMPKDDGIVFSDNLAYVYIPVNSLKLYTSLARADRGNWYRHTVEMGALWVWGGPFYSTARWGIGLSSERIVHNQLYMDLFFEQATYYLMASLSGSWDFIPQGNRSLLVSGGATLTGLSWLNATLRGYAGFSALEPTDLTVAGWVRLAPVSWLDITAGGNFGSILPRAEGPQTKVSVFGGFGIKPWDGWRLGYQYTREYRQGRVHSQTHQISLTGES